MTCVALWLCVASTGLRAERTAPIEVVASFSILADWVRQIGGARVHARALIGPDSDVHAYKPRPRDARALGEARLVIVNGAGLEGWLERLIEASGTRAPVVVASTGIAWLEATGADPVGHHHDGHGHDASGHDPHGWQNVANARQYVTNIAMALCDVDADGCTDYRANLDNYLAALDELDQEIRALLSAVPKSRRVAVTDHAAFRYFGEAYGIRFIAARGLNASAHARPGTLARLVGDMRAHRASSIFLESVANKRLLEQLARDTGARIGGTLYADTLTRAGGPAPSYIDMMRHNAKTLADAMRAP